MSLAHTTAVVLPAYNEEQHIAQVLDALLQHPQAKDMRIVVIDDGSSDGTARIVKAYVGVSLVQHGVHQK